MDFLDLAKKRSSIRAYKRDPLPAGALDRIIEAGRLAPSAVNRQHWKFIVLKDPAAREKLCKAYKRDWLQDAPVIIAICSEPAAAWKRSDGKNYADVDCAIAIDHMTLCAADMNLGTCWIGAFDPEIVRSSLGLPAGIEPIALLPVGIPDETGKAKQRKDKSEIVRPEHW